MSDIQKLELLILKGMRWGYYFKINKGYERLSKREFSKLLATRIIDDLSDEPCNILCDIKNTCTKRDYLHLTGYIVYKNKTMRAFDGHVVWMPRFNSYRVKLSFFGVSTISKLEKLKDFLRYHFYWKRKKV